MESTYLLDKYTTVTPGEPYRLFPFGNIVKGGKTINVTPELAAKFRLPHFKPPIKRGSHKEDAPAGGFIVGLEVRDDGLYAIPEYTDKGLQAVKDGDYRYQSPEVIWDEDNGFEDPTTGDIIHGPLIIGDALLHMPHLGESAALYEVTPMGGIKMTDQLEMVSVPKPFWEVFLAKFSREDKPEPVTEPETEPAVDIDAYEAALLKAEKADEYKAQLDRMEADAEKAVQFAAIKSEFDTDKYGTMFIELGKADEAVEMLQKMDDEVRGWVMQNFKAMSKQIDESALMAEKGTSGGGLPEDPREALDIAIKAKMEEEKVDYNAAFRMIREESPELVTNQKGGK